MSLAIIVSGVLRNMKNASSSWKFDGDYHLVTENMIYGTQSRIVKSTLYENMNIINDSFVNFKTIIICMDTDIHDKVDLNLKSHPTINMSWKWKIAYNNLLPYRNNLNYDRILLIRPDMYVVNLKTTNILNTIELKDKQIHMLKTISFPTNLNGPWMSDMFMLMNIHTFEIISSFYDYYIEMYKYESKNDVHNLLGEYILKNNIIVTDELNEYYSFFTLRDDASNYMFENGVLNKKYTHQELGSINNQYIKKLWKL